MFGLSSMELLIIVILALIFVGPDQLPKVARTLGKGLRQFRGAVDRMDGEVRRVVREASAEFDDLGRPIRDTVESAMREGADEVDSDAKVTPSTTAACPEDKSSAAPSLEDSHSAFKPAASTEAPSKLKATPEESNKAFAAAASKFAERDWSQIGKRPVQGQVAREPSVLTSHVVTSETPHTPPAETTEPPLDVAKPAEPSSLGTSLPIGHATEAELLASLPDQAPRSAPAKDNASTPMSPSTEDKA